MMSAVCAIFDFDFMSTELENKSQTNACHGSQFVNYMLQVH